VTFRQIPPQKNVNSAMESQLIENHSSHQNILQRAFIRYCSYHASCVLSDARQSDRPPQ